MKLKKQRKRNIRKIYYKIGEVATILDCTTSKIRYYHKKFCWLTCKRNEKNIRYYTTKQILKIIDLMVITQFGVSFKTIYRSRDKRYYRILLNMANKDISNSLLLIKRKVEKL